MFYLNFPGSSKMASKTTVLVLLFCVFAMASARWVYVPEMRYQDLMNRRDAPGCLATGADCEDHYDCCNEQCSSKDKCL